MNPINATALAAPIWALAHNVRAASKARIVEVTEHHVPPQHLSEIQARIIESLAR